jgi:hypothetical protein
MWEGAPGNYIVKLAFCFKTDSSFGFLESPELKIELLSRCK